MDTTSARGGRRRLLVAVAAVGLALFGLTSLVTGAFFSDTQTVPDNTFSTGSVRLGLNPTSAAVSFNGMAPGDSVTAPLTVSNTGSLALRYAMLSTTTEDTLAGQLQMTIRALPTGALAATCAQATFALSGTVVYGPGALGSTAGTKAIGDAAQGQQAGDRTLAAGANEVLCVQVTLPTTAGNSAQGKTTTATFRFDGEQTTNNP